MSATILRTPLFEAHLKAGGRLVEFAGYEMPVQYSSVIAEAKAVRTKAGMFDVSHMARLRFSGNRVREFLEWITTNDISKLSNNGGQYSLLPNEKGGAVDDIIVYKIHDNEFRMVVNAANHQKDLAWIHALNTFGVEIEDHTDLTAMIAVQGPQAVNILAKLSNKSEDLNNAPAFGVVNATIAGIDCFAARSGYTGEDGYELICSSSHAGQLWKCLLEREVLPCGLGARDVLRVEAGLPLYSHELTDELSPIAAGLGWVVSKRKHFIGSDHYYDARQNGTSIKLVGIKLNTKRLPMPGMKVLVSGTEVGSISSGVFSPLFDCGIGFAFVQNALELDTPCEVDVRGKLEPGSIVSKRFYKRQK